MASSIRDYTDQDLGRCRELWRALTQHHRDIYGDPTIGGTDPGLEFDAHLRHPKLSKLWVAESKGQVVGLCGLLVEHEESELEPIVVHPDYRGCGIGALLARQAISESRRLCLKFINVRPVGRNLEAIRFFHREGFHLLGRLELSIHLDSPSSSDWNRETEVHGLRFKF